MKESSIISELNKILTENEKYYEHSFRVEDGNKILTIFIDGVDSLKRLEDIHRTLILHLEDDYLDDDTYLELSTVSHERLVDINSKDSTELYVRVLLVNEEFDVVGYIDSIEDTSVVIRVNIKGRIKKISIPKDNIIKIIIEDKI
jgi:anionic cell wall polymer biosynthesis LytR-Cps2A-Psr (LCP) family protein